MNIERAAITARPEDIAIKLRNAPAWFSRGNSDVQPQPLGQHYTPAKARALRRYCGWLSGCVAPSVSVECYNHADKLRVREQFTPACWEMVLDQSRRSGNTITLRYGHEGDTLASTDDITLTFSIDRTCGLQFDGKLRDDPLGRSVIEAATGKGLAVSIAYKRGKGWTVEREGGIVRVIDECIVDHVAVLPEKQGPAYRGARCYGAKGNTLGCPTELQREAQLFAWREIKREAGVRG